MANPFFESYAYPWSRPEARALHEALYRTPALQHAAAISRLYNSAGDNLLPLTLSANPETIWAEALDKLAGARRIEEFCRLILESTAYAAIHDAVRAVRNAKDVIDEVVLSDDRLFIDRQQLRDKLQRLMNSPTRTVLLVRGGAKSGKTWTRHMIVELTKSRKEICIYLSEDNVTTLEDVFETLFLTLGGAGAKRPDPAETLDAWYQRICRHLIPFGKNAGCPSWIVVDDLGVTKDGPRYDPEIKKFFDQFARMMINPAFAEWFRLVLIDYPDGDVPTKWADFWDEDRPDVAHLDAVAIGKFVEQWAQRRKKQIGPEEVERFAKNVIATAEAAGNSAPRLQSIHNAVVKALAEL